MSVGDREKTNELHSGLDRINVETYDNKSIFICLAVTANIVISYYEKDLLFQ